MHTPPLPPGEEVEVTALWDVRSRKGRHALTAVTNFAATLAADLAAPRLTVTCCWSSFICDHLAAGTPLGQL